MHRRWVGNTFASLPHQVGNLTGVCPQSITRHKNKVDGLFQQALGYATLFSRGSIESAEEGTRAILE